MKRLSIIISFLVFILLTSFGQEPDLIIKKDGEKVFCKIYYVDSLVIKYEVPWVVNKKQISEKYIIRRNLVAAYIYDYKNNQAYAHLEKTKKDIKINTSQIHSFYFDINLGCGEKGSLSINYEYRYSMYWSLRLGYGFTARRWVDCDEGPFGLSVFEKESIGNLIINFDIWTRGDRNWVISQLFIIGTNFILPTTSKCNFEVGLGLAFMIPERVAEESWEDVDLQIRPIINAGLRLHRDHFVLRLYGGWDGLGLGVGYAF